MPNNGIDLPTVRALEVLWRRVADRPLCAPPSFFRYLRLRWRVSLKQLDPERTKLLAPRWKVNDCNACTDLCCVGPRSTVLLRLRDIATLVDVGRTDLMTHEKPEFSRADQDQRPALRRQLGSQAWSLFPVLRQTRMGACAALTNGGKCGLYPHWPLACARFPYALHADGEEVFYSRRCNSFWIRPDAQGKVETMTAAAVASYNERIKDLVLLAYVPREIERLGLTAHLSMTCESDCAVRRN